MIQTAEQILETVRTLPKPERDRFFELIEVEKNRTVINQDALNEKNEKFRRALQWVEKHKAECDGKFVVLDGDKLIASGDDSKTVYAEARAKGHNSPFLKRVKNVEDAPFGGC